MSRCRDMTVRVVSLRSREASQPPCPPTVAERLALLTALSREAWVLARRPIPAYTRDSIPVALVPLRERDRAD